jgi:hypothetical protein
MKIRNPITTISLFTQICLILMVKASSSYSQITTDTVVFENKPKIVFHFAISYVCNLYGSIFSAGEGEGYTGAGYDNKHIWCAGAEIGPVFLLNNNLFKIGFSYSLKRVEMDVQTVTAPPWPPPHHEVNYYNFVGLLPSYGYRFKLNDALMIAPEIRLNIRMLMGLIPSMFISPCLSFYFHGFGIFTSFNYKLFGFNWPDETYSFGIGLSYFPMK